MSRKTLLTLVVVFCVGSISAQQDLLMLNLQDVRQSSYINPALGTQNGIHVGLPFMSSVSVRHYNNFLHPGKLFKEEEGHVEFQTDAYLKGIEGDNRAGFELTTDLLSIGFPYKKNYFSFSIREKADLQIQLPRDLLSFPITGNAQFEVNGGLIDLSDLDLSLNHYVEYGFGWQRSFSDQLHLGVRVKVLFGKENVRTTNNNFKWQTDPEDYTWTFEGDFELETSGLVSLFDSLDGNTLLEGGEMTNSLLVSRNLGFGLDIGAQYELQDKWTIGLSLVDIGYIRYSIDNRIYSGVGSDVAFAGIEITEAFISGDGSFSDSLDAAISELGTSLEESFSLEQNQSLYTIGLRTKAYFNIGYELIERSKSIGRVGLTVYSDLQEGEVSDPLALLNYTHVWNDRLSISTSYSFLQSDKKNLGLGMSVRGGPVVFYLTFDNVLWMNMTKIVLPGTDGEVTYPSYSQNAAVHFGMNLLLNRKEKSKTEAPRLS